MSKQRRLFQSAAAPPSTGMRRLSSDVSKPAFHQLKCRSARHRLWKVLLPSVSVLCFFFFVFHCQTSCCWLSVSGDGYLSWRCPSLSGPDPFHSRWIIICRTMWGGQREAVEGVGKAKGTEGRFGWVPWRCLIVLIDEHPTCSLDTISGQAFVTPKQITPTPRHEIYRRSRQHIQASEMRNIMFHTNHVIAFDCKTRTGMTIPTTTHWSIVGKMRRWKLSCHYIKRVEQFQLGVPVMPRFSIVLRSSPSVHCRRRGSQRSAVSVGFIWSRLKIRLRLFFPPSITSNVLT